MSETKPKLPAREITFKVDENSYTIKYPNTGAFLQIETLKSTLRGNNSLPETTSGQLAYFTADMIAFLSTCCPEMRKDLKVNTFSELDMLASKKLLNIYIKTILPWLTEWEILLNTDEDTKVEETPIV